MISMALALALAAGTALYLGFRDGGAVTPVRAAEAPAEPVPPAPAPEDKQPEGKQPEDTQPENGQPEYTQPKGTQPEEPPREPTDAPLTGEPFSEEGWQRPSEQELAAVAGPRRYAPAAGAALTLTIPKLGVYDAPVFDSDSPQALEAGVAHVPETSMPWDGGAQRNVYLAAHRVGYSGAGSRLLFYRLNELGRGDEVILEGRGRTYRYRVDETLVVPPTASWVMGQVRGRDMVTLQTCTPVPTFEKRLVVRADRA